MKKVTNKEHVARQNILRSSENLDKDLSTIKGYDFSKGLNWEELIDSFATTGAQATNLSKAINIVEKMQKDKATIYLGYTSSMVSSGLRDIFRFLVQNKKVDYIVTTCGGIEEDIMKCLGSFKLGDFRASGRELRKKGINRIGNIFVPNNEYCKFEEFLQPILKELNEQKNIITPKELIWKLGETIDNEESICYWAWKNQIPIFCPAITDGAIGDNVYFFKSKNPEFKIDVTEDIVEINNSTIGLEKSGLILLGSGVIKHHILNANMFRNGADYAVYINNAQEFDGSDAGATPDEAVSWGKISPEAESVKIYGDATILFPILVAKTFAKK